MNDNYLESLLDIIKSKKEDDPKLSYTAKLHKKGLDEILKKIGEESAETIVVDSTLDGEVSISSRSREQPNYSDKVDIDLANQMEDDSNAHELIESTNQDYINSSNENTKSLDGEKEPFLRKEKLPQMDRHASSEEVQSLTSSLPRVFLLLCSILTAWPGF